MVDALGTARYQLSGFGTQTAGIAYGGYSTTTLNNSEEYDGSAWSATNAMTVKLGDNVQVQVLELQQQD